MAQAIKVASTMDAFNNTSIDNADAYSVWGTVVEESHVLSDGDRLEVLRELKQDPMQLRRINAERQ